MIRLLGIVHKINILYDSNQPLINTTSTGKARHGYHFSNKIIALPLIINIDQLQPLLQSQNNPISQERLPKSY